MKAIVNCLAVLSMLLIAIPAHAVNFYDGVRAPEGLYLLSYTSIYYAKDVAGGENRTELRDYGLYRTQELVRFSCYRGETCVHLFIPAGYLKIDYYNDYSIGLGDASLALGRFLPIKSVDILPMLIGKFPTGAYDRNKRVNLGSNQFDLKPSLFLHKTLDRLSIDLAVKYSYRLVNPDTHAAPQNELAVEGLLGFEFLDFIKLGPAFAWIRSDKRKYFGEDTDSSLRERQSLSAGGEVYFRLEPVKLSLSWLSDVYAEHATRVHFFQVKIVFKL